MKLLNIITKPYRKIKAHITYDRAVKWAEKNFAATGQRSYVIAGYPTAKRKRHLIVTDRKSFRKMKKSGYINPNATVADLQQYCFYATAYSNGSGRLTDQVINDKRKACITWLIG